MMVHWVLSPTTSVEGSGISQMGPLNDAQPGQPLMPPYAHLGQRTIFSFLLLYELLQDLFVVAAAAENGIQA